MKDVVNENKVKKLIQNDSPLRTKYRPVINSIIFFYNVGPDLEKKDTWNWN